MKAKREIRALASIQRRELTDEERAKGYIGALRGFVPYNSDSAMMRKEGRARVFHERLAPGVFDKSIHEERDIMVAAGHTTDPLEQLARQDRNLTITTDEKGVSYEALVPDTRAGRDLMRLVDLEVITGTSFEFAVRGADGERYEKRDANTDTRWITSAKLYAFNPVTVPSYAGSSLTVAMRSADGAEHVDEEQAKAEREQEEQRAAEEQRQAEEAAKLSDDDLWAGYFGSNQ